MEAEPHEVHMEGFDFSQLSQRETEESGSEHSLKPQGHCLLGCLLNVSKFKLPYLKNEENNSSFLLRLMGELGEFIHLCTSIY